jgi:hypothetical protein
LAGFPDSFQLVAMFSIWSSHYSLAAIPVAQQERACQEADQENFDLIKFEPNATFMWLYVFSSNRIEIL